MIVLWGLAQDRPLAAVHEALHRLGFPVAFLDQRRVLATGVELCVDSMRHAADDYRYATQQGAAVDIRSYDLPPDTADRCRALAAAMDLLVAGIDLRRTPDGHWYCFEVNPSPAFSYYQSATSQPIDEAIARLLGAGACLALRQ